MASLSIKKGPNAGQEFPLDRPTLEIGRDAGADICLADRGVSRRHARIVNRDGAHFIEDLGSNNGTFVNGKKITGPTPLLPDSEVRLAEIVLVFRVGSRDFQAESLGDEMLVRECIAASPANPGLFATDPAQTLQIVLELAQHLSRNVEVQPLLDQLLQHLLKLFPQADRGMAILCEGERLVPRAQRSRQAGETMYRFSRTIIRRTLADGVGILSEDVDRDARFDQTGSLSDTQIRSLLCVPLLGRDGRRLGAIQLDSLGTTACFDSDQLRLLATLGLQAAVALESVALQAARLREESLRRELALGREIQLGFLPTDFVLPENLGLEVYARVLPAREVAGDLYDFFQLDDGRLAIFVGDVSDKGVAAALFMVAVASGCRHLAPLTTSAADTLARLNTTLARNNPSSMFVTLGHGLYDPTRGEVTYAACAHPPPLLRRADGSVEELTVPAGRLLGCFEGDPGAREMRFPLAPGETVILYSDGFTEAFAPGGKEMFGVERLKEQLGGPRTRLPLADCAEETRRAVERFTGGGELQDDLTLLLLRRR